ncbi:hypothetical protein SCB49_04985 [unidentified eubacterium SCB49]|nr:hypothetical protein SCB49_04985 [unidentified eubacterium SCB49]
MTETKIYKSKFGWLLFIILTLVLLVISWLSYDASEEHFNVMPYVVCTILGYFAFSSVSTRYKILGTELQITCFPFYDKKVAIDSIKKVAFSRSIMSSPAPSLDRIEIFFNTYDSVIISPKDKEQFMDHLKQINPCIELVK